MAKDFKKGFSAFVSAKAAESIMAKADEIKNLDVNIIDEYSDNNEDVSNIDDLLSSMKENGFTDPIEVTNYGCASGRYMILSGHRRFAAWTKLHNNKQPIKCIIVDAAKFKTDADVKNYVLMANAQRDSSKDPLLLVKRYKEHEKYLSSISFEGNIRDEIAKRLGVSVQQADRYKTLGKCIPEIQQLVADEKLGMSSAQPIAPLSEEDQHKFFNILQEALSNDARLTRDYVKHMVDVFKEMSVELSEDEKLDWKSVDTLLKVDTDPSFTEPYLRDDVSTENDINNEAISSPDPSDDVQLTSAPSITDQELNDNFVEDDTDNDFVSDSEDISRERKNANNLIRTIKKLEASLENDFFEFEDEDAIVALAKDTIESLKLHLINPYTGSKK